MLGAFGNLKESAAKPGPGAYNMPSAMAQNGGGPFSKAPRAFGMDANTSAAYANAMKKEEAYQYTNLPPGDEALDQLLAHHAVPMPSVPPAAAPRQMAMEAVTPPLAAPRHRAPMPHNNYLRSIDTTPRLLHGNIFPNASYVNGPRYTYNKQGVEAAMYAYPWRDMGTNREPVQRGYFHIPNEFSSHISAAARMGLKPFGGKDR